MAGFRFLVANIFSIRASGAEKGSTFTRIGHAIANFATWNNREAPLESDIVTVTDKFREYVELGRKGVGSDVVDEDARIRRMSGKWVGDLEVSTVGECLQHITDHESPVSEDQNAGAGRSKGPEVGLVVDNTQYLGNSVFLTKLKDPAQSNACYFTAP